MFFLDKNGKLKLMLGRLIFLFVFKLCELRVLIIIMFLVILVIIVESLLLLKRI